MGRLEKGEEEWGEEIAKDAHCKLWRDGEDEGEARRGGRSEGRRRRKYYYINGGAGWCFACSAWKNSKR